MESRKSMGNIILIGFMGCGKSSVGLKLSYRMRQTILDTDKEIERKEQCTISEIFAKEGETAFRDKETAYLQSLVGKVNHQIVSTGGGLPMREENRKLLKEIGTVVYLRVKPETVYERLKNDTTRPLLQGDDPMQKIRDLLGKRSPVYEAAADIIVDVDNKSFDSIIAEITEAIQ